jgi:inorganic pyrophosphatase
MSLHLVGSGKDVPNDINVIIEISAHSTPVKYEVTKESGTLMVDRILATSMTYPCNYGYVPHTLCDDGDPLDVLVITPHALISGSVIRCRPVAVLTMEDESGEDDKILSVPVDSITQEYLHIKNHTDFPEIVIERIEHFFSHYKDLAKGKWVKINGWENAKQACKVINKSVELYHKMRDGTAVQ